MMHRLFLVSLSVLCVTTAAMAQTGPGLTRWKPTSTDRTCSVITNNQMQPQIPSAGFGIMSEEDGRITLLVRGYMTVGTPPKSAEIRFANRTAQVPQVGFGKLDDYGLHGIAMTLDLDYLTDVAESESFNIRLDGENFATYSLAERGQAVAYLVSCLRARR